MKEIKNYIASIDIGTQNIVVVVGQMLTGGKLRIVANAKVATVPGHIVRGEIKNLDVTKSIKEALDEIKHNYGLEITRAYVSLSGHHITCQKHTGYVFIKNSEGAVQQEDIDVLHKSMYNLKLQPGQKIISILPQSYILDGEELLSPKGMLGTQLKGVFNVIIGDESHINLCHRVLKKCGVEVSALILSSIASSRATLVEGEAELGVMVVDIGAGTTDVAIYCEDNLKYTGVIPIGGASINKDIRSIGIMEKYIEIMKVCYGNAVASTVDENITISLPGVGRMAGKEIAQINLANIIEARYMDIIIHLQDIMNSTSMKNRLLSGIVLTGGASNVKNIDQLFGKCFNCTIRVSSPIEYVDENYHESVENPIYSTAIGLLFEGSSMGDTSVVREYKEFETIEPISPEVEHTTKPALDEVPVVDLFHQNGVVPEPELELEPVVSEPVISEPQPQPVVSTPEPEPEPEPELELESESVSEPVPEPEKMPEPKVNTIFSKLTRVTKKFIQDLDKE